MLEQNQIFANRYRLVKRMGSGAFSEVWKAEDTKAGDLTVAVKIYAPDKGMDEDGIAIFSKEFSLVFNVNHQNLLKPTYFDVSARCPFLILPYCSNGSTYSKIGVMSENEIVQLLHDIAAGLEHLHKQNPPIIHQDIKPDNILINESGDYLITDFGISTKIRSTLRKSVLQNKSYSAGTIAYMAPERFGKENKPIKASDIWSLGATIFELMTTEPPFFELGGLSLKNGAEIPNIDGNYSTELKQLIEKCLAKEPWNRPMATQLKEITEEYLKHGKWSKQEKQESANINSSNSASSLKTTVIKPSTFDVPTNYNRKTCRMNVPAAEINPIIEMAFVKGGTFYMGTYNTNASNHDKEAYQDEFPAHKVTLSDFNIGKYPITQKQWMAIMSNNPSNFKGDDFPVDSVNWDDCQKFIDKLNAKTGKTYRLPTEAEWEYAARGGIKSNCYKYSGANNTDNVAWHSANSNNSTHAVGTKRPNELNIYDMSGNVYEWCQDWYGYYSSNNQINPLGASSGSCKVLRGGSWDNSKRSCRCSNRRNSNPDNRYNYFGFRIAIV
ncbi:MAG: bifunctional serine/threonine-protein kinase/formylglycine-generating enzyme family protein [Bacteroidales bacterium]|jgi:formylglycine-generating enzyme required for sulfatase activity|nr:bifunctional serine/threonine-protein kinase/formylglycine-generating enzyme family protein [Bacteroidales bacterium]MDD2205449.1 bifunctional serine/threonine-protein kinase/formylglycine-generating enzyme family protein [Bacteroidales bacterium]MDD3152242.1 bifunctional serine/threonine-protein kinase/formylglycine-generating enzyme family protein [Bacteroidales bacterium]MDD3914113.1 bifunctional serine/threonine-protein kinase/formylglycine-generating enzyme family protein [Bacteroidales 